MFVVEKTKLNRYIAVISGKIASKQKMNPVLVLAFDYTPSYAFIRDDVRIL